MPSHLWPRQRFNETSDRFGSFSYYHCVIRVHFSVPAFAPYQLSVVFGWLQAFTGVGFVGFRVKGSEVYLDGIDVTYWVSCFL